LPLFDGESLRRMIELATYVAVNDYEAKLVSNKTGWSIDEIAGKVEALIITLGEQGAQIHHAGVIEEIPAVKAQQVLDPTGCGDAFRGGLLYGIENKLGWATTGRLASLMGALKIEHQGPQNYAPSRAEINERFKQAFEYDLP
jgi:adenosine kinase